MLTDSPVRQELLESFEARKRKISKKTITAKSVEINFLDDDNSEENSNEVQVNEGDFAVIRCQGKSRSIFGVHCSYRQRGGRRDVRRCLSAKIGREGQCYTHICPRSYRLRCIHKAGHSSKVAAAS